MQQQCRPLSTAAKTHRWVQITRSRGVVGYANGRQLPSLEQASRQASKQDAAGRHLVGQVDDLRALGEAPEVQLPHAQVLEGAIVSPCSHAGLLRGIQRAAERADRSAEDPLPPVCRGHKKS